MNPVRNHPSGATMLALTAALALATVGCGATASLFNPAFVNTLSGGVVPVTPGPAAKFVFVRCVNETDQAVEFIVTIEREVLEVDDAGNFQVDEQGQFVTRPERQTVRLRTFPNGQARELGTVFACAVSPVTVVGLGEDLLPTDAGVFVGGQGVIGATGFGVPASAVNPLRLGNFNCGDTIIFRAFRNTNIAGGVGLQSFLLPGSEQPSVFLGPSTFATLEQLLESQVREDEP